MLLKILNIIFWDHSLSSEIKEGSYSKPHLGPEI
jgi:hypothetical protein